MVSLLVCSGGAHVPNEIGDQVGELLLMALGELVEDRCGNGSYWDRLDGWVTLSARHGFPPWPA